MQVKAGSEEAEVMKKVMKAEYLNVSHVIHCHHGNKLLVLAGFSPFGIFLRSQMIVM